MVHPYLRRRANNEKVDYPSPAVAAVLERTLGVPIFQEQVMQLAIVAAGFCPVKRPAAPRWAPGAQRWHRALQAEAARGHGRERLADEFAQRIYRQMLGFGEYGFPESHAASFALLVYDSSWLKYHEPAAFTCALLNSQPMGFYGPAQLVRDARAHGVEVRPVDVQARRMNRLSSGARMASRRCDWECGWSSRCPKLEVCESEAARIERCFESVQDLARRAALDRGDLEALAAAGALSALSGNRHLAYWEVAGTERSLPLAPQGGRAGSLEEGRPLLRSADGRAAHRR